MNFSEDLKDTEVFATIAAVAAQSAVETYVVGGYVRDLLLKRPCKDIDLVCVGSGIDLAETVAKELNNALVTTFKNFGTAMIRYGEYDLEFVGARKESYRNDSRKPIVEDGTLDDDQEAPGFYNQRNGHQSEQRKLW